MNTVKVVHEEGGARRVKFFICLKLQCATVGYSTSESPPHPRRLRQPLIDPSFLCGGDSTENLTLQQTSPPALSTVYLLKSIPSPHPHRASAPASA